MSILVKNKPCSNMLSFGGLLVFWGIQSFFHYSIESDQNSSSLLKVQAGQAAGLNLFYNLPTVHPQGQSGDANKAVMRLNGALRFCVLSVIRPYSRGKPRAPSE